VCTRKEKEIFVPGIPVPLQPGTELTDYLNNEQKGKASKLRTHFQTTLAANFYKVLPRCREQSKLDCLCSQCRCRTPLG
jgi:hypothetical protein